MFACPAHTGYEFHALLRLPMELEILRHQHPGSSSWSLVSITVAHRIPPSYAAGRPLGWVVTLLHTISARVVLASIDTPMIRVRKGLGWYFRRLFSQELRDIPLNHRLRVTSIPISHGNFKQKPGFGSRGLMLRVEHAVPLLVEMSQSSESLLDISSFDNVWFQTNNHFLPAYKRNIQITRVQRSVLSLYIKLMSLGSIESPWS